MVYDVTTVIIVNNSNTYLVYNKDTYTHSHTVTLGIHVSQCSEQ